jgi:hypothetical protein
MVMKRMAMIMLAATIVVMARGTGFALVLNLGAEQLVQAGGVDIAVNGYSVPSYVDWNNDGLEDLISGEGGGGYSDGKVRVYLNSGTAANPQFTTYSYAQSNGSDLVLSASGCLGAFPRLAYWDGDARKDLLIGHTDGTVRLYLNTGTDENPTFDGGTMLQVGAPGSKVNIDVGYRATPMLVDWDSDGLRDMAVGGLDGKLHIFVNAGTNAAPDFLAETYAQESGSDLIVPSIRLSPIIFDFDEDGKKDLLTGNTEGQLLFYSNTGTDAAPSFSGYLLVEADGVAIDLPGIPRSRPFVCDWTGDGYLDVLIGAADGQVHLYEGVPEPVTVLLLGLGALTLLKRRRS